MIDIGANLANACFDADRDAVLQRARAAGVEHIVITGSCRASNALAAEMVNMHPDFLSATAGVHPHHARDWEDADATLIRTLAADGCIVSLGECGLDYFRDVSPRPAQHRAFEAQLSLASELGLPLFLHQRDAHADFLALLRPWRPRLGAVVVHCFTDTAEALHDYLDLDCHVGLTGWVCDERRGHHLLPLARAIPADKLLVETDAPYLLPRSLPKPMQKAAGRRNEPAFLPWVIAALAAARDDSPAALAAQTAANARRFFGLDQAAPAISR